MGVAGKKCVRLAVLDLESVVENNTGNVQARLLVRWTLS